jgi:hypothetical protein
VAILFKDQNTPLGFKYIHRNNKQKHVDALAETTLLQSFLTGNF